MKCCNYVELSREEQEKVKLFFIDFVNKNHWLDKRVSFSFGRNPWLNNFISKDDLKQDFYYQLLKENSLIKLCNLDLIGRVKYTNSIFSNILLKTIQRYYDKGVYPFDDEFGISGENVSSFEEKENLEKLFLDETLENQVIKLLKSGLNHTEVMEQLDLSRRKYDAIRENIKRALIDFL